MRILCFSLLLLCIGSICCAGGAGGSVQTEQPEDDVDVSCMLSPIIKLAGHPSIIKLVNEFNQREPPDHELLDSRWPTLPDDSPELQAVLENPVTPLLKSFIALVSLQGEGMVIGKDGGLAAATNHTTDYWQADEAQYQLVMESDDNSPKIIESNQDESTGIILIKISVPILDAQQQKIGVLVIGFDSFVMEFRELCAPKAKPDIDDSL